MKGNLLLGTAKGKLGDVVAKVTHGEQILSKYQPNVHNPRTPIQVEQREIFARSAKELKKLRALFDQVGLISVYNRRNGSSRNIRNTFMPLSIASQRAQLNKSQEFIQPRSATDIVSRIGNDLSLQLVTNPSSLDDDAFGISPITMEGESLSDFPNPPATIIFGSDVPLGKRMHIFTVNTLDISCGDTCRNSGTFTMRTDLDLELVELSECPEVGSGVNHKQEGFLFYGDPVDYTKLSSWPYIYKVEGSPLEETILNSRLFKAILGPGSVNYAVGFYMIYDSRGVFISSGTMDSTIEY